MHRPAARSIELAEIDPLPPPEHQLAVLDQHGGAGADQARLDMAVAVALTVAKARLRLRNAALQPQQHVMDHVGISVLVDRDGGRRVRTVDDAEALAHTASLHRLAHALGDLDELVAAARGDRECDHRPYLPDVGVLLSL